MAARNVFLVAMVSVVVCAGMVSAQKRLADLVAEGGYDWVIGRWVATTDEGQTIELRYDWALDRHAVLNSIAAGEFRYQGLVMLPPLRQEATDAGADNQGGVWKGRWYDEGPDLIHHLEHTGVDGRVNNVDVVHSRVDANTITIALFAVDGGARVSGPWGKLTYKRRPEAKAGDIVSTGQGSRYTDYRKLGDLVSEAGYEWLIGKWTATQDGRQYTLENKPILDGHAVVMEAKIDGFQYCGLITFSPRGEEIGQIGADNMGGVWKGTWVQGDEGPIHKIEYTRSDGTTRKIEHVYVKTDRDTFKVKEYTVESGGSRASEPRGVLTFTRQKPAAQER